MKYLMKQSSVLPYRITYWTIPFYSEFIEVKNGWAIVKTTDGFERSKRRGLVLVTEVEDNFSYSHIPSVASWDYTDICEDNFDVKDEEADEKVVAHKMGRRAKRAYRR